MRFLGLGLVNLTKRELLCPPPMVNITNCAICHGFLLKKRLARPKHFYWTGKRIISYSILKYKSFLEKS